MPSPCAPQSGLTIQHEENEDAEGAGKCGFFLSVFSILFAFVFSFRGMAAAAASLERFPSLSDLSGVSSSSFPPSSSGSPRPSPSPLCVCRSCCLFFFFFFFFFFSLCSSNACISSHSSGRMNVLGQKSYRHRLSVSHNRFARFICLAKATLLQTSLLPASLVCKMFFFEPYFPRFSNSSFWVVAHIIFIFALSATLSENRSPSSSQAR
mmetsp:Transcript_3158/g.3924  ORF Transcript_3158/g.3924 Transcript_3158/m.3924 type:complete len:209 (+) Transcript_3158:1914-2540(+)